MPFPKSGEVSANTNRKITVPMGAIRKLQHVLNLPNVLIAQWIVNSYEY